MIFNRSFQNFLWFENLGEGRKGATETPLNTRVLPTYKINLDTAKAS